MFFYLYNLIVISLWIFLKCNNIVFAETANRGNTAYDTALYNAATMYVAQQNKTGGGG